MGQFPYQQFRVQKKPSSLKWTVSENLFIIFLFSFWPHFFYLTSIDTSSAKNVHYLKFSAYISLTKKKQRLDSKDSRIIIIKFPHYRVHELRFDRLRSIIFSYSED